ncbi:MAG: recombinase family protein [Candidatus Tenebribacter davisii]|nr:recombinase family protein [Candidatus Tenebribacter davisii]
MQGVLIYTRISTGRQYKRNNTLPVQSETCHDKVKTMKLEVINTYSEVAAGDDPERLEMNQMLAYIKANSEEVDYLIVSDSKRLSRSVDLAYKIVYILRENKVKLIDCSASEILGEAAYTNFINKAYEGELEKKRNAKATRESIALRKDAGELTGRIPYGIFGNLHEVNEVTRMFNLALKGYNYEEISEKLSSDGYSKNAESTIRHRLKNLKYTGILIDDKTGKIIKGKFPVVIDKKLFNDVQEIIKDKKKQRNVKNKTMNDERLPLRNVLFCKHCGKAITGSREYYSHSKCGIHIKNEKLHDELLIFLEGFDYTTEVQEDIVSSFYKYLTTITIKVERLIKKYQAKMVDMSNNFQQLKIDNADQLNDQEPCDLDFERIIREIDDVRKRIRILEVIPSILAVKVEESIPNISLSKMWSINPVDWKKDLILSLFPEKLLYDGKNFSFDKIGEYYTQVFDGRIPSLQIASNKIGAFCHLVKQLHPYPENKYVSDDKLLNELYQEIGLIEVQPRT